MKVDEVIRSLRAVDEEAMCQAPASTKRLANEAANLIAAMRDEIDSLEERGAKAVLAYHVAIASPKGVVPVDDIYDPAIATEIDARMDRQHV